MIGVTIIQTEQIQATIQRQKLTGSSCLKLIGEQDPYFGTGKLVFPIEKYCSVMLWDLTEKVRFVCSDVAILFDSVRNDQRQSLL